MDIQFPFSLFTRTSTFVTTLTVKSQLVTPTIIFSGIHFLPNKVSNTAESFYDPDLYFVG